MNALKRIPVICLLLAASYGAHAQDCNFDTDEKDKFSGEITRKADQRMGGMSTHWNLLLEQKGKKLFLGLKTLKNTAMPNPVQKGDKFYLKLEDGKVIAVAADQDYAPSFYAANGGVQTTITTRGEVDAETMKSLSQSPITDIKMMIGSTELTSSGITSKQARKIMDLAGCLATVK